MNIIYNYNLSNEEAIAYREGIYLGAIHSLVAMIQKMKIGKCLKLKYWAYFSRKYLNYLSKIIKWGKDPIYNRENAFF